MNNLFLNYFLLFVDVRSLFEDYKNIELKIKNEQLTLNETGIDLRFVNRKQELLNAWETYAANIDYKDVKQTLLVSGQMYGSGKTVFGKQLFNFNNPYIKSVFENEFKTYSSSAKDILSNTLPVYIDVRDFVDKFDSMYHLFLVVYLFQLLTNISRLIKIQQLIFGKKTNLQFQIFRVYYWELLVVHYFYILMKF